MFIHVNGLFIHFCRLNLFIPYKIRNVLNGKTHKHAAEYFQLKGKNRLIMIETRTFPVVVTQVMSKAILDACVCV